MAERRAEQERLERDRAKTEAAREAAAQKPSASLRREEARGHAPGYVEAEKARLAAFQKV